jgi:hypothetical protein
MIRALADSLHHLRTLKPKTKDDVASWYVLARKLEAELVSANGLSPEVPSLLWHYLADADIRFKDEAYADLQDHQMRLLVQCLKRGEIPSDDELRRYIALP